MENILLGFAIIVGVIVVATIVNEKKLHFPHDIGLLILSTIFGMLLLISQKFEIPSGLVEVVSNIKFDSFLLECALGFIIFAGASKIRFNKFVSNIVPITFLALFSTIISSIAFGGLFYLISICFSFKLDIWTCLLLGSLISIVDSNIVTGALAKLGLSKSTISVMEGESILSDGSAVAIFVFAKGMITNGVGENFLFLIFKEIICALVVGYVVSFFLFKLIKMTNEPILHILISLLDVSISYVICEHFGFSGVIASMVCGMYFSYQMNKISRWKEVVDSKNLYEDFWHVIEVLLNSILFVLVGFSIISMGISSHIFILIPTAIVLNLISRCLGVSVSTMILKKKKIPNRYSFKEFVMLLTWTGIKGGVSLALVLTLKEILPSESYLILLNSTIIIILFTMIVQGLTAGKLYKYIEKMREKRIEAIS